MERSLGNPRGIQNKTTSFNRVSDPLIIIIEAGNKQEEEGRRFLEGGVRHGREGKKNDGVVGDIPKSCSQHEKRKQLDWHRNLF